MDWKHWLLGLWAAFLTAAAGAIDSSLALVIFAPEAFDFGPKLKHTLLVSLIMGALAGYKAALAYLKQSPVPRETWTNEERDAKTPPPPAT